MQQIVFQEYVGTVKAMTKRVAALDQQIESAAAESVCWPVIEGLMALRGVNLLTATTIVAEIGDLRRFAGAPQLMAYLGVVPSEPVNQRPILSTRQRPILSTFPAC